ncbi:MAG: 50S ribosome-binding GTPase, partial [Clostridia bacterium]|nr:50S ribosome-binding GTPase [Clostridia bacterium]
MSGATLNETPSGERVHIGFFGIRNAGKSSVVNAVTGQDLAVVSDVRGTTTDPVKKAMELLPIGPVVIIDTPGFDDEGALGEKRVERTRKILAQTDLAILVTDGTVPLQPADRELISIFEERKLPYLIVRNKADLLPEGTAQGADPNGAESPGETDPNTLFVSAVTGAGIHELKERMGALAKDAKE